MHWGGGKSREGRTPGYHGNLSMQVKSGAELAVAKRCGESLALALHLKLKSAPPKEPGSQEDPRKKRERIMGKRRSWLHSTTS